MTSPARGFQRTTRRFRLSTIAREAVGDFPRDSSRAHGIAARRVSGCEPDIPSGTAEALGRPNEHVRLEIAWCLSSVSEYAATAKNVRQLFNTSLTHEVYKANLLLPSRKLILIGSMQGVAFMLTSGG